MIFTPYQQRTLRRRTAAELRQKFLRETETFLAGELQLRGISLPAKPRALRYRRHSYGERRATR